MTTNTSKAPERIWLTNEDHGASWPGAFRAFRASDLDHGDDYPKYVRSDIHAAMQARAEKAETEEQRLRKVLKEFARQSATYENADGDFEGAYDIFIEKSRAALRGESK